MINEAFQLRIVYRRKISNFLQIFSFAFHRSVEDGGMKNCVSAKDFRGEKPRNLDLFPKATPFNIFSYAIGLPAWAKSDLTSKGEAIKKDAKSRTLCTTKRKSLYGNMCKFTQCEGVGEGGEKQNHLWKSKNDWSDNN